MTLIKRTFARLCSSEEGATLVEYGIALGIAVTVGAGALLTMGGNVNSTMGDANAVFDSIGEGNDTEDSGT
ncbi:hypothetical protein [uncultured Sulfitobacter sp.]|uniref:Flp family type IVb pilin n=1 Tax=uncultured Sulfitobacter sp. TaxID=191468 RepID=UPI002622273C|nr:hypothetical protein [uncultured Sulfitobacter sp.]